MNRSMGWEGVGGEGHFQFQHCRNRTRTCSCGLWNTHEIVHLFHYAQTSVISQHFPKKTLGKSGFFWPTLASGEITEGLDNTTTSSGRAEKESCRLVTTTVEIRLHLEAATPGQKVRQGEGCHLGNTKHTVKNPLSNLVNCDHFCKMG